MEQDQYVKVNIKESTRTKLKDQARTKGMTLADYIEWLGANVSAAPIADEADALLEQLDKQAEEEVAAANALFASLDDDELPECCQGIYSGRKDDRCEHWIVKNSRWFNRVTNRYIDDPAYVNYFQNM